MKEIEYSYNFVLYKEYLIYNAIGNDIVRRAMGISIYRSCRLTLIDCEKKFVDHVLDYVADYPIEIVQTTLDKVKSSLKCKDGDIIITHTWPDTLFKAVNIFKDCILVLIEEVPPLYDRFPRLNNKQTLLNKFLTWNPILKVITGRYRRAIHSGGIYVAISDIEADVIKGAYDLKPDIISYDPVDDRYFNYVENERNAIMTFGSGATYSGIIDKIIKSGLFDINEIICVNIENLETKMTIPGLKITTIKNYTFEEIRQCYARTAISITAENRGSFELIPIESIMSGVPIISPPVPSLEILQGINRYVISYETGNALPFFDYYQAANIAKDTDEIGQFYKWLKSSDLIRNSFSTMATEIFSISHIAKDFIYKVEKILGVNVVKNIQDLTDP